MEEVEKALTKREKRALAKEKKKKDREKGQLQDKIKKIGIGILVITAVVYGGFKFVNWIRVPQSESSPEVLQIAENEWIKGNVNAPVTIIEYSDFQCPACASYAPVLRSLSQEYPDDLRIVYRHFPLVTVHANAIAAARAAEAAGKQGRFWEMHDMLFSNQDQWSSDGSPKDKFTAYAKDIGLDEEKFLEDLKAKDVEDAVDHDLAAANQLRLNSTPSFFLNGEKVAPAGFEAFKGLIDEKINSSE